MHRFALSLGLSLMALSAAGCRQEPSFERLTVRTVNAPTLGGDVDESGGEVYEGTLVAASLEARNSDDDPMELSFVASHPEILDVKRVSDRPGWWAFIGAREGYADVDVVANDEHVRTLRFVVLRQK